MAAANDTRAATLLATASPYLLDQLKTAPLFGSVGIILIFHEGLISRVDISASIQHRTPRAYREGGDR